MDSTYQPYIGLSPTAPIKNHWTDGHLCSTPNSFRNFQNDNAPQQHLEDFSRTPSSLCDSSTLSPPSIDFSPLSDLPEDVVDLVTEYSSVYSLSNKNRINLHSTECTFDQNLVGDLPLSSYRSPKPLPFTPAFKNYSHDQVVKPRTSDIDKRRLCSRDASRRYRRKTKLNATKLRAELDETLEAYHRSRMTYEKTREAFDVLQKIVLDLIALT